MGLNNWNKVSLGSLVESISSKYSQDLKKVVIINTSDVLNGKVLNHDLIENRNLKGQFKKSFQKGDILYSEIRPKNRRFAYVDFDAKNYIASTKLMVLRRSSDKVTTDFLYQLLTSNDLISQLQNLAESRSGTFPQITYNELSKLKISLPPINEQEYITMLLKSLNAKINVNVKVNQNLEEMAQAIFKHWFVDFEFPDENGNPYKSSGGEMVESELGCIPSDWSVRTLNDISTLTAGGDKPKTVSKIRTNENPIPIYSNGIRNNGLYGYTSKARVFDESVTVSARGTIGFVCLRGESFVPIVRLVVVVPNREFLSGKYLYQWLKRIHIGGTGTTQQQLTVPNFKKTRILLPTKDIMQLFTSIVTPLYAQMTKGNFENSLLVKIRDTLLPKLMSGEIRVPTEQKVR